MPEVMLVNSGNKDERERVIDDNLKRVFDETLDEGIPDRFLTSKSWSICSCMIISAPIFHID